ncbi:50S ribosomal protein L11 methyltransferase [Pseudomonadota bacterium]
MPWQQLSLEAGDLNAEELSTFFESRGALSVTFVDAADQPLFEPDPGTTPLWSATLVTALFDANAELGPLKQQLAETYGAAVLRRLIEETLHDRDWERAWLDQFHPMQFGEHLWICPDGQRPPPKDDQVLIDLDPGLAFGTGTHPTTALCLTWLDQHPPVGQQVLDFGCGSGILAIAALKLGAAAARGVDIDPQALWASHDNATRNSVDGELETCLPNAMPEETFDLVLANILANPLIELAAQLSTLVRPGGMLVLSGILAEQAAEVQHAYEQWFTFTPHAVQDGWVRLQAQRN